MGGSAWVLCKCPWIHEAGVDSGILREVGTELLEIVTDPYKLWEVCVGSFAEVILE